MSFRPKVVRGVKERMRFSRISKVPVETGVLRLWLDETAYTSYFEHWNYASQISSLPFRPVWAHQCASGGQWWSLSWC